MKVPPKLKLRCPPLAVANKSLEFTLFSWGAVDMDVDWKIVSKDGVQVAKGKIHLHKSSVFDSELQYQPVSLAVLLPL